MTRAALVLLLVASCSSSPAPDVTAAGSVARTELRPASVVARVGEVATSVVNGEMKVVSGLHLLVSDRPNSCGLVHASGSTTLAVAIPGAPVRPGTYTIVDASQRTPGSGEAEADFDAVDETCQQRVARTATAGTVVLSGVVIDVSPPQGTHLTGSFDLQFGDDRLSGAFEAVQCEEPSPVIPDGCPR